jgi:hypothetical protein
MTGIPEQMKNDTWTFYVYARSNNPEIAVPYTRKLVSNLISAMHIMEDHQHEAMLIKCLSWANDAIQILANPQDPRGWGKAMINCEAVIDEVGILIYDPEKKWAITQSGAFKFPTKEVKA